VERLTGGWDLYGISVERYAPTGGEWRVAGGEAADGDRAARKRGCETEGAGREKAHIKHRARMSDRSQPGRTAILCGLPAMLRALCLGQNLEARGVGQGPPCVRLARRWRRAGRRAPRALDHGEVREVGHCPRPSAHLCQLCRVVSLPPAPALAGFAREGEGVRSVRAAQG
jgi:hypothetical protein